jgi:hypothetical protein
MRYRRAFGATPRCALLSWQSAQSRPPSSGARRARRDGARCASDELGQIADQHEPDKFIREAIGFRLAGYGLDRRSVVSQFINHPCAELWIRATPSDRRMSFALHVP